MRRILFREQVSRRPKGPKKLHREPAIAISTLVRSVLAIAIRSEIKRHNAEKRSPQGCDPSSHWHHRSLWIPVRSVLVRLGRPSGKVRKAVGDKSLHAGKEFGAAATQEDPWAKADEYPSEQR